MKATDNFSKTIQKYLDDRAAQDSLFAETLKKPNKNIEDCVTYILNQVKASGINGFADEDIFGMAVHYYDEDDIKPGSKISAGNVVVNHHVELTESEKENARKKAIEQATAEMTEQEKKNLKINVQLNEDEIAEAKKAAFDKVIDDQRQKLLTKKVKSPTVKAEDKGSAADAQASLF